MTLKYETERIYARAYNRLRVNEKWLQKLKVSYPSYYGIGTAALIGNQQTDLSKLTDLLSSVSESEVADKLRLNLINQITTIIDKIECEDGLQFTPNQNLMFPNCFFSMIAELLAGVFYKDDRHSDLRSFQRQQNVHTDYAQLLYALKKLRAWLNTHKDLNYIQLENYLDASLQHIASMTLPVAA